MELLRSDNGTHYMPRLRQAAVRPSTRMPKLWQTDEKPVDKRVRISIPNTEALGGQGLMNAFIKKDAYVRCGSEVLWQGKHGVMAVFEIDRPVKVTVDLGFWANETEGSVAPGHRYQMVQDQGAHLKATFRLSEVDVIDSGY